MLVRMARCVVCCSRQVVAWLCGEAPCCSGLFRMSQTRNDEQIIQVCSFCNHFKRKKPRSISPSFFRSTFGSRTEGPTRCLFGGWRRTRVLQHFHQELSWEPECRQGRGARGAGTSQANAALTCTPSSADDNLDAVWVAAGGDPRRVGAPLPSRKRS